MKLNKTLIASAIIASAISGSAFANTTGYDYQVVRQGYFAEGTGHGLDGQPQGTYEGQAKVDHKAERQEAVLLLPQHNADNIAALTESQTSIKSQAEALAERVELLGNDVSRSILTQEGKSQVNAQSIQATNANVAFNKSNIDINAEGIAGLSTAAGDLAETQNRHEMQLSDLDFEQKQQRLDIESNTDRVDETEARSIRTEAEVVKFGETANDIKTVADNAQLAAEGANNLAGDAMGTAQSALAKTASNARTAEKQAQTAKASSKKVKHVTGALQAQIDAIKAQPVQTVTVQQDNTKVDANTHHLAKIDGQIKDLKHELEEQKKEIRSVGAMSAALAGLSEAHTVGATAVSWSAGTYNGESALALSASTRFDNHWSAKLGGATTTQGDTSAFIGGQYEF